MTGRELRLDALVGRRVVDPDGKPVGPLEEITVEQHDGVAVVVEYRIGAPAAIERFAGSGLGGSLLFHLRVPRGYRVPWDRLDLADPAHPRLLCPTSDLRPAGDDDD